jgi:hypothetical protein
VFWNKATIWGLQPDFYYCETVLGLLMWGALSNERTGLLFTIAAGPCQRRFSISITKTDIQIYFLKGFWLYLEEIIHFLDATRHPECINIFIPDRFVFYVKYPLLVNKHHIIHPSYIGCPDKRYPK